MSPRRRLIMFTAIGAAFAIVAIAPFALMLLPNPKPVAIADITSQMPGYYVRTSGRTFHVFPSADKVSTFPAGALVAGPDAVFIVKYRQLAQLSDYTLWSFDTGEQIEVERDLSASELLQIRAVSNLPAGRYYAITAKESIYGGEDYVYFAVSKDGAAK